MNEDLEAIDGLCEKIAEQRDRIETLETALWGIIEDIEYRSGTPAELLAIARTALNKKDIEK